MKIGEIIRNMLKEALSRAFLLILLGSTLLWYASKLSQDYTTEMPMNVRIDGERYRLVAMVEGRGSTLVAWRLSLRSKIDIHFDELETQPAPDSEWTYLISPESLQKALSAQLDKIRIVEVIDAPEFTPPPRQAEEDA